MTINELMMYGEQQVKNTSRGERKDGSHVRIKMIKNDHSKSVPYRVAVTVYEEPFSCHFKSTDYWLPIYIPETKRLYLVYSDKKYGYKMHNDSNNKAQKVGRIEFTKDNLLKDISVLRDDTNAAHFNWKWDHECNRPFVEIK